jgi:hypothetical protein
MGHKVKGYRRNAEYGKKTRRRGERGGWRMEVNPPGKDGWEKSGVGRSEKEYGKSEGRGNTRRERVEEVRRSEGYETNGRGRKGDEKKGYVVCGEYVKVVEKQGKRAVEGREGRREELKRGGKRKGEVGEEGSRDYGKEGRKVREGQREKREKRKKSQLEIKRERRARRYESEVGRKVTRERVNRSDVRGERGRRGEVGERMRGRVSMERSYREKRTGKGEGVTEGRREKRGKARAGEASGEKAAEVEGERKGEREKRRKRKERKAGVRREARAVVVVRGGVMRMERRRVKRRIRKREGAGRAHMRVRREMEGRRKYHGRKSKNGRVAKGTRRGKKGAGSGERKGGYYGYRVTVKGPLNGARRTTTMVRGRGTVPESRKEGRIGTAEGVAKTSVGTRGVQVGYCYGIG